MWFLINESISSHTQFKYGKCSVLLQAILKNPISKLVTDASCQGLFDRAWDASKQWREEHLQRVKSAWPYCAQHCCAPTTADGQFEIKVIQCLHHCSHDRKKPTAVLRQWSDFFWLFQGQSRYEFVMSFTKQQRQKFKVSSQLTRQNKAFGP